MRSHWKSRQIRYFEFTIRTLRSLILHEEETQFYFNVYFDVDFLNPNSKVCISMITVNRINVTNVWTPLATHHSARSIFQAELWQPIGFFGIREKYRITSDEMIVENYDITGLIDIASTRVSLAEARARRSRSLA